MERDQLTQLRDEVQAFCDERDWAQYHDIKELAIGLITESSELLELFRFQSKEQSEAMLTDPAKRTKIEDELADVFFFVLRLSGKYGIDLPQSVRAKMVKNAEKYPVEKSRGSNRKYDEL